MTGRPDETSGAAPGRAGWLASVAPCLFMLAVPLVMAFTGCAKDPTELYIAVALNEPPPRVITSLSVTLEGTGAVLARDFAYLGTLPPDANGDVAPFVFPVILDYQIPGDAPLGGLVNVTVQGTDPLIDDTVLASGTGAATIARGKTTTTSVTLTLTTPPAPPSGADAGTADADVDAGLVTDGP